MHGRRGRVKGHDSFIPSQSHKQEDPLRGPRRRGNKSRHAEMAGETPVSDRCNANELDDAIYGTATKLTGLRVLEIKHCRS